MLPISSTSKNRRAGFTLIELLLASALLLAAGASIVAFMSQGIRLFSRLSAANREEDAAICLVKITRDLKNMTNYSLIPFEGAEDSMSFASLEDLAELEGDADPSPLKVIYTFDAEHAKIAREALRPATFERGSSAKTEVLLSEARLLKFEYDRDPDQIPRRVKVTIEYKGLTGWRTLSREVLIPSALIPVEA